MFFDITGSLRFEHAGIADPCGHKRSIFPLRFLRVVHASSVQFHKGSFGDIDDSDRGCDVVGYVGFGFADQAANNAAFEDIGVHMGGVGDRVEGGADYVFGYLEEVYCGGG